MAQNVKSAVTASPITLESSLFRDGIGQLFGIRSQGDFTAFGLANQGGFKNGGRLDRQRESRPVRELKMEFLAARIASRKT